MTRPAEKRRIKPFVPRWLLVWWAISVIAVVLITRFQIAGDDGSTNISRFLVVVLAFTATLIWFSWKSAAPRAVRLGALGLVVTGLVLMVALFRIDNLSGALVPDLAFRWSERPREALAEAALGSGRIADLETTTPYDFPGFLGVQRDQQVRGVRLARDWSARPPELLWRQPIGAGWSGFAVVNGFAATLEQRDQLELVTLYDAETGELVWSHVLDERRFDSVPAGVGPRSTPTIAGGRVFAQSVFGTLVALDGSTGKVLWEQDLRARYGVSLEQEKASLPYGRPASPLVLDGKVVVPAGGPPDGPKVSVVAFDQDTGELLFEGGSRQISMSSPGFGRLAGRDQILMVNEDWASGHDADTGEVLWETEWPGPSSTSASASQAVAIPPGRVFLSKGYGEGGALFQLEPSGNGFELTELWRKARSLRTKFSNVSIRQGYLYALSEGVLECVEIATGERAWKAGRYGHGQMLMVDDLMVISSEDGEVYLVEATPERKNNVLGSFEALDGVTWNNFALSGDLLLVRNAQEAAAFRLPLASS